MKGFLFLIALVAIVLSSCKFSTTNSGQVNIHFDSLQPPSISKKEVLASESCILRFCSDFNSDTVMIFLPNDISDKIIVSTNKSIAYASSYAIKKYSKKIIITIDSKVFSFQLFKNYIFVDIYYDRKKKAIDIYYSNNILLLS